jgi:HEPN domain-containing protein
MSIPDQDHIENVILWMNYADEDLGLANYAMKMPGSRPYRLIAYHAQQCAEKYLKAYLVYHDIDFPYTHDIKKLLNLCGSHKWIEKIKDAEELTPYAISSRYPGLDEPVTEDEAHHAVNIASKMKKTIRKVLTDDGITIEEGTIN